MKKKNRRGGAVRLIFFIIVLVVAAVLIRLAAGKIFPDTADRKAAEQTASSEAGSAADLSARDSTAALPLASADSEGENGGENPDAAGLYGSEAAAAGSQSANTGSQSAETGSQSANTGSQSAETGSQSADTGSTSASKEQQSGQEEEASYDHVATELEKGREYLDSLEERTPVEMEYMITEARKEHEEEVRRQAYQEKRREFLEGLEGDKLWEAFDHSVFLGDSRVVGFEVFGFLPSKCIIADSGGTINLITDQMDSIKALSPKYIFISFGINDIGIGFWPTEQEYVNAFSEKLDTLQNELPDAEIYVNSILPAREDAVQTYPIWGGLPEYSEAVRRMCEEKGISFIDNDSLIEEHSDLYATDGVHMQPDFYRYWAENQMLGTFDRQNGLLTF